MAYTPEDQLKDCQDKVDKAKSRIIWVIILWLMIGIAIGISYKKYN